MTPQEAVDHVKALPGVFGARLWTKVAGKERIYVETVKSNGGHAWNGGVGFSQCFIEIPTKKVVMTGEAGAATRKQHARLGTMDALKEIAQQITANFADSEDEKSSK